MTKWQKPKLLLRADLHETVGRALGGLGLSDCLSNHTFHVKTMKMENKHTKYSDRKLAKRGKTDKWRNNIEIIANIEF